MLKDPNWDKSTKFKININGKFGKWREQFAICPFI